MTVFSYPGRVKSPEWRRQLRRADLQQFQIFGHGPVIIYTRLPARGIYYPICMFPTNSERLIGISDVSVTDLAHVLGVPPTKALLLCATTRRHGPVYTGHACRNLPSAVPWISEDRLLSAKSVNPISSTRRTKYETERGSERLCGINKARELTGARKTSHKHNNNDMSRLHPQVLPVADFTYLVFARMLGESYRRRLRSLLLCLCDVFRTLIKSLVSSKANRRSKQSNRRKASN